MSLSYVRAGLLLAVFTMFCAQAAVLSVTGQVVIIAPPADARLNALESNTVTQLFTESLNRLLAAPLTVDFNAPGTYSSNPVSFPTIPAGTRADSYYLITDPVGSDANNIRNFVGSITFSTDILGAVVLDPAFASSNAAVGNPGTLYSTSGIGLELGNPDTFTISANRRTLSFSTSSNTAADDIRIITAATTVPEPASVFLIGFGVLGMTLLRRRLPV